MDKPSKSVTLTVDERSALEAICRRRKVDALVWKRARAFLLLDAGRDAKTICEILDIAVVRRKLNLALNWLRF